MPSSYYQNIPAILDIITKLKPQSILDVGPGYGKYGFLIREYCDNFMKPALRIDGVEIYPDYYPDKLSVAYNRIYYRNFLDFQPHDKYDLILLIDVLEHFTKDDAHIVLDKARDCATYTLVSTPHGFMTQGERNGNPHEEHKSGWDRDELPGQDFSTDWSIIKLINVSDKV